MTKTPRWHKGVEKLVCKDEYKNAINETKDAGSLPALKKDFILLVRRNNKVTGIKTWVDALKFVMPNSNDSIIRNLRSGGFVPVPKSALRRVADTF